MSDDDSDEAMLHIEPSAHVPQDVPQSNEIDNDGVQIPQQMAIKEDGKQEGRDPTTGQFIAGWKGGGRKKGSKDKLNQQVIATMEKLWSQRGEEIMDHLADTKPEVLAGLIARLIPQSLAEEAIQGVDSDEITDKNQEVTIRLVQQASEPALPEPAIEVEGELLPHDMH